MKWFKMDCDAQENLDMRKLIDEWGWDWYGRYWAILGKIGMLITEKRQTFALQTNDDRPFPVKLLANDLGTTVERLTAFCKFLADNRLIDTQAWNRRSLIYAPKLRERADEYTEKLRRKSRHSHSQEIEVDKEVEEDKMVVKEARPQSLAIAISYFLEQNGTTEDAEMWFDHFESNGWKIGGRSAMKDWRASVRYWMRNKKGFSNGRTQQSGRGSSQIERATFRHGEEEIKKLESLEETLRRRRAERSERS